MRIESTDAALRQKVDLEGLVRSLDFSDEEAAEAARTQPALFLLASIYRVQKMRKRQRREAKLKVIRSQYAKQVRRELTELGQRITDKQIEERLTRHKHVIELEAVLARAEQEEEFAKLLLTSMHMRRDALKVVAELVGAEVYVSRRLENSGTELTEIRKRLKEKYPGHVAKEEWRNRK